MEFEALKLFLEIGAFPFLVWLLYHLITKRIPEMEVAFITESKADRELYRDQLKLERELFGEQLREQHNRTNEDFRLLSGRIERLITAIRKQTALIVYHDLTSTKIPLAPGDEYQTLSAVMDKLNEDDNGS